MSKFFAENLYLKWHFVSKISSVCKHHFAIVLCMFIFLLNFALLIYNKPLLK